MKSTIRPQSSNVSWHLLLAIVCILGFEASAQQSPVIVDDAMALALISNQVAESDSKTELLFWVMGFKQTRDLSSDAVINMSDRKQLINAGISPNRILTRTFFNKAVNYENTIT